jgi:hypothetical protein
MTDTIATYDDPVAESVLLMGVAGSPPVLVSTAAEVDLELKNGFDNQRHKAKNFGRVKFLGIDLAKISVDFVVMPDEERDFWAKVVPLFRQKGKRGNAPPIDVTNLQMNRAGITTVTVLACKIHSPNARDGRKVSVQLQEWAPAPSEPKKPTTVPKFDPKGIEDKLTAAQIAAKHS